MVRIIPYSPYYRVGGLPNLYIVCRHFSVAALEVVDLGSLKGPRAECDTCRLEDMRGRLPARIHTFHTSFCSGTHSDIRVFLYMIST